MGHPNAAGRRLRTPSQEGLPPLSVGFLSPPCKCCAVQHVWALLLPLLFEQLAVTDLLVKMTLLWFFYSCHSHSLETMNAISSHLLFWPSPQPMFSSLEVLWALLGAQELHSFDTERCNDCHLPPTLDSQVSVFSGLSPAHSKFAFRI